MIGGRKGPSRRGRSSRGRGGRRWLWALLAAVLLVGAAVPASSFDTASLDRPSAVGVVADTDALLGIDHAQTVTKQSNTLVVITNRFAEERVVTVSLTSCTDMTLSLTTDGQNSDGGEDGSGSASVVTFSLPAGGSQAVTIEGFSGPQCSTPVGTLISTSDGLTTVTAEREADAERGGGPGNGNGNGNGGGPPAISGVLGDG
jgi:hypothetical protein